MAKRKLSDTTVQTALKAIEEEINANPTKGPRSIEDQQALFDARRELTTLGDIAAGRAIRTAGRPKGSKNKRDTSARAEQAGYVVEEQLDTLT